MRPDLNSQVSEKPGAVQFVAVGISLGVIIAAGIAHYQVYFLDVGRAYGVSKNQISFAELMVVVDLLLWLFMIYAWDKGHKVLSAFLL